MKRLPLSFCRAPLRRSEGRTAPHVVGAVAERCDFTSTYHWIPEYLVNEHSIGLPSTESPTRHSTTRWRRRSRRYLRIILMNALKGAGYTLGGAAVTWLIWWFQTG
jgi:hypothetical protein